MRLPGSELLDYKDSLRLRPPARAYPTKHSEKVEEKHRYGSMREGKWSIMSLPA